MKEEIRDLIGAIVQGEASKIQDAFDGVMAQKVSAALDDLRVDVAKNMFNAPSADTEE